MNIKEQKGITLFILVITVVIMSILAGTVAVSIRGYGDLADLKNLASDLQNLREKVDIYYEKYNELPVSNVITEDFATLLGDKKNGNDGALYYKINLQFLDSLSLTYGLEKFEKDYFVVNEQSHSVYYYAGLNVNNEIYYGIKEITQEVPQVQFGVQSFELKTRTNATVTDGVLDIQLEVYSDTTIENASRFKFKIDNEEWTSAQDSNSYTFHNLKQNGTYTVSMIIIDNEYNEIYATNNEMKVTIRELPISLTVDGKTTGTYNNPLIPAGFVAINENNAIWQSSDGYKNGLVITDEVDASGKSIGNEFVWVPVDGTIVTFARQDWRNASGTLLTTPANTLIGTTSGTNYTETVPTVISDSVTNNGGFYIGRYESGKGNVVKKGVAVYNNIDWNNSKIQAEAMYPSSNANYGATSTLIYSTQWDTALKFIGAYNVGEAGYSTYAIDSTGMGNYISGDSFTSTSAPANCGALPAFRQKNIYDMAGNVWEWTMESYGSYRPYRGGDCNTEGVYGPAAGRYYDLPPTGTHNLLGFRAALYLK